MNRCRDVFDGLVMSALTRAMRGSSDGGQIYGCYAQSKPIPDHLLPGRMIMALPEKERDALTKLTSAEVAAYRWEGWA